MSLPWINFMVVIGVQLALLLIHAWYENRLRDLPKILLLGCDIGIVFGISFDYTIGHLLGLYTYELGFTFPFLFWNGLLSFGFMQANVLLMQKASLKHFWIWSAVVGIIYEATNYYFPVWTWMFGLTWFEYLFVILVLYVGLACLMATLWHFMFKYRFVCISNFLVYLYITEKRNL